MYRCGGSGGANSPSSSASSTFVRTLYRPWSSSVTFPWGCGSGSMGARFPVSWCSRQMTLAWQFGDVQRATCTGYRGTSTGASTLTTGTAGPPGAWLPPPLLSPDRGHSPVTLAATAHQFSRFTRLTVRTPSAFVQGSPLAGSWSLAVRAGSQSYLRRCLPGPPVVQLFQLSTLQE